MKKSIISLVAIFLLFFSGCEDFLEQQPTDRVINQNVIKGVDDLRATTLGIYDEMQSYLLDIYVYGTLLSDEGMGGLPFFDPIDLNQLNSGVGRSLFDSVWRYSYKAIYNATFILEEIEKLTDINPEQKDAFVGELKFLRAYHYLLLTQGFGALPLVTTTDATVNSMLPRTDVNEIYTSFVLPELLEAEQLIPASYPTVTETKTRATKAAVQAALVYLYLLLEDWENAELVASTLIENTSYDLEENYDHLFDGQAYSEESIWQLYYETDDANQLAYAFLGLTYYLPGPQIIDAFEPGDVRFNSSVTEISPGEYRINKYRNTATSDDKPYIFRLADIYLLRAEARAHQSDLAGAIADVDVIRSRANLPLIADTNPGISQADLLLAIEQERFVELCFEGMKRWFDLLRTNRADAVMGALNPDTWDPEIDKLWPIPQRDLDANPNMEQNPGY